MFEVAAPKTTQNKMYNSLKHITSWKAGNSKTRSKYQKCIPVHREAF